MTMQAALRAAAEAGCYARPVGCSDYAYRYVPNGRRQRVAVTSLVTRPRRGQPTPYHEDGCMVFDRRDVEDEWMLCGRDGGDIGKVAPGPRLADLV